MGKWIASKGRFFQSDPIRLGGGDAYLFRYCGGDPINGSDRSGFTETDGTTEPVIVNGTPLSSDYPFGTSPQDLERMFGPTLGGANSAGPDDITAQILLQGGLATTREVNIPIIPPEEKEPEAAAAENGQPGDVMSRVPSAISSLENAVSRYTANFPQAPPASPVVEALKQAQAGGHIQIGPANAFLPGEGMHTFRGTISINPRGDFTKFGLGPLLAHEGEHIVDTTSIKDRFHRERNAYDVQYYFSTITGPIQPRYSDEEIRRDLARQSHRLRY
jgi:hypothetical protein